MLIISQENISRLPSCNNLYKKQYKKQEWKSIYHERNKEAQRESRQGYNCKADVLHAITTYIIHRYLEGREVRGLMEQAIGGMGRCKAIIRSVARKSDCCRVLFACRTRTLESSATGRISKASVLRGTFQPALQSLYGS